MPIDDVQINDAEIDSFISSNEGESPSQPAKDAPAKVTTSPSEAAVTQNDGMTPEQREAAEQAEIDNATPEQRKVWDKKFLNALSRRDKDRTQLRAERDALKTQLAELQKNKTAAQTSEAPKTAAEAQQVTNAGGPDIKKYDDFGKYTQDVIDWKIAQAQKQWEEKFSKNQKTAEETRIANEASAKNEQRIVAQAKELIAENPEYLQVFQENADIVESLPRAIADALAEADYPALAFLEIAKIQNGFQALSRLSPAKAAMAIGIAQAQGLAKRAASKTEGGGEQAQPSTQTKVSNAPAPLRTAKTASSGGKNVLDGNKTSADDIVKWALSED